MEDYNPNIEMNMTKRKNKKYPNKFKEETVALVIEQDDSIAQVAAKYSAQFLLHDVSSNIGLIRLAKITSFQTLRLYRRAKVLFIAERNSFVEEYSPKHYAKIALN